MSIYVVVATHNRHEMLKSCLSSLFCATKVFCIDNASTPGVLTELENVEIIRNDEQPPNLSRLWNIGLERAKEDALLRGENQWEVAVINDDTVLPECWLDDMARTLREHSQAVIAFGDQWDSTSHAILHTTPKTTDYRHRITGYAHISKGEIGLRFDESMLWWYSDDDYDWQARLAGGSLLVPKATVKHLDPNGHTSRNSALQAQADKDKQTFLNKWGMLPT